MKFGKIFLSLAVIFGIAASLVACAGCEAHRDKNDDGLCDACSEPFADVCDVTACIDENGNGRCDVASCSKIMPSPCEHKDENDDKKCDGCTLPFSDGCDSHVDMDDNGECDFAGCDEVFFDGCDRKGCLDTNADGLCDNEGCDKPTQNAPCNHRDADDNGRCDECSNPFTDVCDKGHADKDDNGKCDACSEPFIDGCDIFTCLDSDADGLCDNEDCDKETDIKVCAHRDENDDETCDRCGVGFSDACDVHRDADDDGACDECETPFLDVCDLTPHVDEDDNGACDECGVDFTDGCDVHKDENDDYICDVKGCKAVFDDGLEGGSFRLTESYLPSEITDVIYKDFENRSQAFARMNMSSAPFAYCDSFNLSDCRVLSITIPIYATKSADKNGDFTFTLYKFGNSFESLSSGTRATYKIKINKDEYGLTPDDTRAYKTITIDLRAYNISLTDEESIAFGSSTDTIVPAYLHADKLNEFSATETYKKYFERGRKVLKNVGKGFDLDTPSLCFNLEIEREYESREDYDELVAYELAYEEAYLAGLEKLKEIYGGMKVSVLGDSISTFNGLSNNSSYNMTFSEHGSTMYPQYDITIDSWNEMYWGRVIDELDMELCVDNAWSGSMVCGKGETGYKDSAVIRASELHKDNGTSDRDDDVNPNLILFYMGTNDMDSSGSLPVGDLLTAIDVDDGRSEYEKIDEWFNKVLARYKNSGGKITPNSTYSTFDQAYALSLYRMKETYGEDVQIICLNIIRTRYTTLTAERTEKFNRVVTALGNYFGAVVAEQAGPLAELTFENGFLYTNEIKVVHPSGLGHEMMGNLIIKTLFEKHGIELPEKP